MIMVKESNYHVGKGRLVVLSASASNLNFKCLRNHTIRLCPESVECIDKSPFIETREEVTGFPSYT